MRTSVHSIWFSVLDDVMLSSRDESQGDGLLFGHDIRESDVLVVFLTSRQDQDRGNETRRQLHSHSLVDTDAASFENSRMCSYRLAGHFDRPCQHQHGCAFRQLYHPCPDLSGSPREPRLLLYRSPSDTRREKRLGSESASMIASG